MPTLRSVAATASGLYRDQTTGRAYRHDELLAELPKELLNSCVTLERRSTGVYLLRVCGVEGAMYEVLSRRRSRRGEATPPDAEKRAPQRTVVIVEDDGDLRGLLRMLLVEEGFRVVDLDRGGPAVAVVRAARPDLVVVDMILPDMTGIELMQELWITGSPTPPAIAISGAAPLLETAAATGLFAGVLPKPFGLTELHDAVRQALASPVK